MNGKACTHAGVTYRIACESLYFRLKGKVTKFKKQGWTSS